MKIKRTLADAIYCGSLVAQGFTVCQVESMISIPKSTVHWLIKYKLSGIDRDLYNKCSYILFEHKHGRERRNDWTGTSTKSN